MTVRLGVARSARGRRLWAVALALLFMLSTLLVGANAQNTQVATSTPAPSHAVRPDTGPTSPFVAVASGTTSATLTTTVGDTLIVAQFGTGNAPTDTELNSWNQIINGMDYVELWNTTAKSSASDTVTNAGNYAIWVVEVVAGETLAVGANTNPEYPGALTRDAIAIFGDFSSLSTCSTSGGTAWRFVCTDRSSPPQGLSGWSQNVTAHSTPELSTNSSLGGFVWMEIPAQPPTAPTGLVATTVSASEIDLSWSNPVGESLTDSNYSIWTGAGCVGAGSATDFGSVLSSYPVTGLAASTTYSFEVAVTNATGWGPESNCASATTEAPPLPATAPTNLVATPFSVSAIYLAWLNPIGESLTNSNYSIWSGAGCVGAGSASVIGHVTESFIVTGLASPTTYSFEVAVTNATGYGPESNCASATTFGLPPILSAVSTGPTTVALAWTAVVSATIVNYTVVWEDYLGTYSYSAGISFSYDIVGLPSNATVYVRVLSWTGVLTEGPESNVALAHTTALVSKIVMAPVMTATSFSFSSSGDNYAYLNWSAPVNWTTVNYTVLWAPIDAWPIWSGAQSNGLLQNAEEYQLPCMTYVYEVQAWNSAGHYIVSNPVPVTSGGCAGPPAPPSDWLYAALGVGVLAFIVGVVFFIRRRGQESEDY